MSMLVARKWKAGNTGNAVKCREYGKCEYGKMVRARFFQKETSVLFYITIESGRTQSAFFSLSRKGFSKKL